MTSVHITRQTGPVSFDVAETVTGGHLVEGRTGSQVGLAAAGSVKVLGIALNDAVLASTVSTVPVGGVLDATGKSTRTAVAYGGAEALCEYAANAAFGELLVAAAGGKVTPAGATPDARTIVGRCTEPAGVVIATNPYGLVRTV